MIKRLPRIPFPPSTDEQYFDHDANIHRISKIEEQLTANIHSMDLLRAQIAREEQLLKQDQAEVDYLERSLKSNEVLRKEQSKTSHPIARGLGQDLEVDLLALDNEDKKVLEPSVAGLFEDDDLRPVLQHLQNHLDSMHANATDLGDVKNAIKMAAIELEVYGWSSIDNGTYKQAVGVVSTNQT